MTHTTLKHYLEAEVTKNGLPQKLADLITGVAETSKEISYEVSRGALAGVLGMAGTENIQGEDQKKLDVISNRLMVEGCIATGAVSAMASEEMDHALLVPADKPVGPYLICFDPLDGSSNIDINVSIGTIFSVLPIPKGASRDITDDDFLQSGDNQLAAGYVIYGPQTQLVFTVGRGVAMFTLDPDSGDFILTTPVVTLAADTKEFAINMSNMRHWQEPVKRYVAELLQGTTGVRGKDFNMRWVAAMVAEVHRILSRGGIFMYPRDDRDPAKPGKLRLMYEANPMSWLIEQSGGASTDGRQRILSIAPEKLHQRVAVFLGAKNEVELVTSYHKN